MRIIKTAKLNQGFTLVELMVVVAILGILMAIAIPNYTDYMNKSRRSDGRGALLTAEAEQHKWYFQNGVYSSDITTLLGRNTSPEGYYTLVSTVAGNTFTITATATGKQIGDTDCREYSIDNTGLRAAEDDGGADTSDTCW